MAVDWTKRGVYIAKHGITVAQVSEALPILMLSCSTQITTRDPVKVFAPLAFRLQPHLS